MPDLPRQSSLKRSRSSENNAHSRGGRVPSSHPKKRVRISTIEASPSSLKGRQRSSFTPHVASSTASHTYGPPPLSLAESSQDSNISNGRHKRGKKDKRRIQSTRHGGEKGVGDKYFFGGTSRDKSPETGGRHTSTNMKVGAGGHGIRPLNLRAFRSLVTLFSSYFEK